MISRLYVQGVCFGVSAPHSEHTPDTLPVRRYIPIFPAGGQGHQLMHEAAALTGWTLGDQVPAGASQSGCDGGEPAAVIFRGIGRHFGRADPVPFFSSNERSASRINRLIAAGGQ